MISELREGCNYVFIPNEEYKELAQAKRDADCLKAILQRKVNGYIGIKHEELELICTMFGLTNKMQEEE